MTQTSSALNGLRTIVMPLDKRAGGEGNPSLKCSPDNWVKKMMSGIHISLTCKSIRPMFPFFSGTQLKLSKPLFTHNRKKRILHLCPPPHPRIALAQITKPEHLWLFLSTVCSYFKVLLIWDCLFDFFSVMVKNIIGVSNQNKTHVSKF